MEFTKKKYIFRGMDGYGGFRRNQEYELELAQTDAEDEAHPAEIAVINPVSRLYMYFSKSHFREWWEAVKK